MSSDIPTPSRHLLMHSQVLLRARRDIEWRRSSDERSSQQWYAYDPIARVGYRCGETHRRLFAQFDGRRSLAQIIAASLHEPSLAALSHAEIEELARTWLARGLVQDRSAQSCLGTSPNPGSKRSWSQWFAQSVSWRMRGIDPHRILNWFAPHLNWLFGRLAVRLWLLFAVCVTVLVLADFTRLMQQATLWQWCMRPASGSMLLAIFVVTRAVHELGHALVLTRFGGRCPDIGLIFMLGAPCVYCDVTDSWRLTSRWQRALVAAGGMYAELIIAALSGVLWLCTVDGVVNTLALQTMIVCSISTVLINANPLMRFDGYYILSDWLNEPALRAKADRCAMEWLQFLVIGRSSLGRQSVTSSRTQTTRHSLLALFSILGVTYRLSLSLVMANVIIALYAAWNLAWVGRVLAVFLCFLWWVVPTMKLISNLLRSTSSAWARVRMGAVAAWVVLLVCAIPLPRRQSAKGWVQPTQMQGLYVQTSARLQSIDRLPGSKVKPGERIVQLSDTEPKVRSIQLHHAAEKARVQLVSLRRQRYFADASSIDVRGLESAVSAAEGLAAHADAAVQRMSVRAETAGTLMSMPAPRLVDIDNRPVAPAADLWLDASQTGRMVPAGTMLGAICGEERMAIVPLSDEQLRDITIGTEVRLRVLSLTNPMVKAKVTDIVRLEQLDATSRLLAESLTHDPTRAATHARQEPTPLTISGSNAVYAAIIPLTPDALPDAAGLRPGAALDAVFVVPAQTVARRLAHWARANARWLMP